MPKESRSITPSRSGGISEPELLKALLSERTHLNTIISSVPTQRLKWALADKHGVEIHVRRDDLIHQKLSGNKLYKLWGHIQHWRNLPGSPPIVSFGGAFSNHLYALAAFGELAQIQTYGIIRGERPKTLSPTLVDLIDMGMSLVFVSRTDYRHKHHVGFIESLVRTGQLPCSSYVIPEGGGGEKGLEGCVELGRALAVGLSNSIVQACGTGTTLTGLLLGLGAGLLQDKRAQNVKRVLGVSALKSDTQIIEGVFAALSASPGCAVPWVLSNQFHGGGFAKRSKRIDAFVAQFEEETALRLERVYTGKVVFGLAKMIENGVFSQGESVLLMHSGGLQGNRTL